MEQTGPVPQPQPAVAWTVVPVDFTVVKKGQEMELHNATGHLAFRFAEASRGGGAGRALLDAAGGALVTVRNSGEGDWKAFRASSLEQRDIIFTAKVISASLSQKEVHIFIPPLGNCEDPKPSYRLLGCTFRRACTIIKGNSIVAQTNLLYKLKKVFYSRHKFRVTIYPDNDHFFVMAMIMTFFIAEK